jgi:MFS family permease
VLSTVFGLGAALSNGLAGFVVQGAGYSAAFLTLAAIAALALGLLLAMPETLRPSRVTQVDPLAMPDDGVA